MSRERPKKQTMSKVINCLVSALLSQIDLPIDFQTACQQHSDAFGLGQAQIRARPAARRAHLLAHGIWALDAQVAARPGAALIDHAL